MTQVDKKAEAIIDAARRKEAIGVEKAGLVGIVIIAIVTIGIVIKETLSPLSLSSEKAGLVGIAIFITVNIVITKGKIS